MNEPAPDQQLDALFALARARGTDTAAAEYAFETRLMARLRAARSTDSIWARVAWRLVPLFATGMVALTLWQSEVVSETNQAATFASMETSETLDTSTLLN